MSSDSKMVLPPLDEQLKNHHNTVKERKLMKDPTRTDSRVFISGLPTDTMVRQDLINIFAQYGPIEGVLLGRGFSFVQFYDESIANKVIEPTTKIEFRGRILSIHKARLYDRSNMHNNEEEQVRDRSVNKIDKSEHWNKKPGEMSSRSRKEKEELLGELEWLNKDAEKSERNPSADRERELKLKEDRDRERFIYREREIERRRRERADERERERRARERDDREQRIRERDDREKRILERYSNEHNSRGGAALSSKTPVRRNDCEIIVTNKDIAQLVEYAEFIEMQLKKFGLTVDVLFPLQETQMPRVLASIAKRGTLYAIIITPQNEEHRSLTVNIFHGQSQEHRNMPVKDALNMIANNFEAYSKKDISSQSASATEPIAALNLTDRHPEPIQVLLTILAGNKQLTVLQYDRLLYYLQDRRDKQVQAELGEDITESSTSEVSLQQTELQQKILSILNSKNLSRP